MKAPYCEDVREVSTYEVAFVGVPFDMGTTYRRRSRFGPQAVRRTSALYDGHSIDGAVDLQEELDLYDGGGDYCAPNSLSTPQSVFMPVERIS